MDDTEKIVISPVKERIRRGANVAVIREDNTLSVYSGQEHANDWQLITYGACLNESLAYAIFPELKGRGLTYKEN